MSQVKQHPKIYFFLVAILMLSVGCLQRSYGANLIGYNHTKDSIASYSVKIGDGQFTGAGFLGAGSGGGGMTCCIQIPTKWTSRTEATVKFEDPKRADSIIVKRVLVPQYSDDTAGHVIVHFLADGNVKVFVTKYIRPP